MTIAILHLSDLHVQADRANPLDGWLDELAASIATEVVECDEVLICVTGDIAFSGRASEYMKASNILGGLGERLRQRSVCVAGVTIVPGNHDCDFDVDPDIRESLLTTMASSPSHEIVVQLAKSQQAYREFHADSVGCMAPVELVDAASHQVGGRSIQVLRFNSAWMSSLKEKPGTIRVPPDIGDLVERLQGEAGNHDHVIWMMHHPLSWFRQGDQQRLRAVIDGCADVVLTGHEHESVAYLKTFSSYVQVGYGEGGALQVSPESPHSECSLITIDCEARRQRTTTLVRQSGAYVCRDEESWSDFVRNQSRTTVGLIHTQEFNAILEDPGANFQHPQCDHVRLSQIYVYPDLRSCVLPGGSGRHQWRDVLDYVRTKKKVVIIGRSESGKTSMAKMLVTDLLERSSLATVLLKGEGSGYRSGKSVRDGVRKAVREQYGAAALERVMSLKPSERCLVIDDFDLAPLGLGKRSALLGQFGKLFDYVVLMSSGDMRLSCLESQVESDVSTLFEYDYVDVLEMGYVKRDEMVRRWHEMAGESREGAELAVEVQRSGDVLNSLIKTGLLPANPIVVLVLLQQMEVGRAHDTTAGSQGYLYQTLIQIALRKKVSSTGEMDQLMDYLTSLAWRMRDGQLTRSELVSWHAGYCQKQLANLHLDSLLPKLCSCGIVREDRGEGVEFRYNYIRNYFVARHLSRSSNDGESREYIETLIGKLHIESSSNTILFLAHLSGKPVVMDMLLAKVEEGFDGVECWDPSTGADSINGLIADVPRMVLEQRTFAENRLRSLEALDDQGAGEDDVLEEDESEDDLGASDYVEYAARINGGFKAIQILGQILRSYPGSFDGQDKVRLARACRQIGFRILQETIGRLEKSGKKLAEGMVKKLSEMHPEMTPEGLRADVCEFLFSLCERSLFGVVRHISRSMGHRDMFLVFESAKGVGCEALASELVDLSLKLDYADVVPVVESVELFSKSNKNFLVATVVKHLVWQFLNLYPTTYSVKQKLCAALKIEHTPRMVGGPQKMLPR